MARAKRHYILGHVWHTPVKQSSKDPRPEDVALICPQRGLVNFELKLSFTGVME
jgi:hypothetical protein